MNTIHLNLNETISLYYENNIARIKWIRDGVLVVDRPAYGAEEKLIKFIKCIVT